MIKECNKNAPINEAQSIINTTIINGKTYKIKELNAIFSIQALMLASKEELYKYWQMAVETGVKRFITNVDNVFNKRFPRYE